MGLKGLELAKAYPAVLPKEDMDKIIFQSIPFGANDGDFATRTIGDNVISGYIFSVPGTTNERADIATLTVIFGSLDFQPQTIKKTFSFIVQELTNNDSLSIDTIERILPQIYDGLTKGSFKIKVHSKLTIEFEIDQTDKSKKTPLKDFSDDVW